MLVPFFSIRRGKKSVARTAREQQRGRITPRKGGGASSGGRSGGTSSSSSGGKSGGTTSSSSGGKGSSGTTGKASSSSSSSSTSRKTTPISTGGSTKSVSTYSSGGGKSITIATGQLFGGRTAGGATRNSVYGSRSYGSGYPGYYGRGVANLGFPFWFWPVAWGSGIGYGANSAYLHTDEYGQPDNSSRPGGPLAMAAFQSNSTGTTFRLVADNNTVADLMTDITTNCSQFLTAASINATLPTPFSNASGAPEQVVQYYRASSVALTLDGYNNTAVFAPENSTADTPLPTGIDTNLLGCLNATIGIAVPLVDGAAGLSAPDFRLVGLLSLLLLVFH